MAAVLLVFAAQCSAWRGSLWQDRHSQLSEMQVRGSPLPRLFVLSCIMLCLLGWAGLASAVLFPSVSSVLLCPIGEYGQGAVLCCLCPHRADMAVDASCQHCACFQQ